MITAATATTVTMALRPSVRSTSRLRASGLARSAFSGSTGEFMLASLGVVAIGGQRTLFRLVPGVRWSSAAGRRNPPQKRRVHQSARRKEKAPMVDPPQSTLQEQPTKMTTVEARQGTGPRDMVTVLVASL